MSEVKNVIKTGKRKVAKARASLKKGTGIVRVNKINLDAYEPKYLRQVIQTPLIIAGDLSKTVDIDVTVIGGGMNGQADAAKQAIANALVEWSGSESLKKTFLAYNRNLIVSDSRTNETSKFSRSSAGPRRRRQSSKR